MASSPDRLGDWLLLDDDLAPPPAPRRSGPWRRAFTGGGRSLYLAAPGKGWIGAPWRELELARGRAWLLGEPCLPGRGDGAAEWLDESTRRDGDLSALGGRFLLLSFEDEAGRFTVATDRFNTLHVYATGDGRAVSTSFAAASSHVARDLDWRGLCSFFGCGFFLGERTFWRGVRCLAPARRHELGRLDAGGLRSTRYWRWRHRPERSRTPAETVEAFGEVFEDAVVRRLASGRVALPLSGGLDSRALAAAAPPGTVDWSFAYGYQPGSIEVRLARRLAAARGLPFESMVIGPYLPDTIDHAYDLLEGFQDLVQARQLAFAPRLAGRADAVLAGHWGDVWLDDMGLGETADDGRVQDAAMDKLVKRGSPWLLDTLCRPHVQEPRLEIADQVRAGLAEYGDIAEADFRLKAFKTDYWSSRWTLTSLRAYQAASFPRLPFYDPRLADFFATVPCRQLAGRRLEIDYITRRAPELARVPWQVTGAGLHRSRRAARWLGLPRRAVARAARRLRGTRVIERNWQVQLLGADGRRLLDERLLARGLRLHDLVDVADVRALVDGFTARPTPAAGYTVSMLLSFAVFLERA